MFTNTNGFGTFFGGSAGTPGIGSYCVNEQGYATTVPGGFRGAQPTWNQWTQPWLNRYNCPAALPMGCGFWSDGNVPYGASEQFSNIAPQFPGAFATPIARSTLPHHLGGFAGYPYPSALPVGHAGQFGFGFQGIPFAGHPPLSHLDTQVAQWPHLFNTFNTSRFIPGIAPEMNPGVNMGIPSTVQQQVPFAGDFTGQVPASEVGAAQNQIQNRMPAINMWEEENGLILEAEVPGVNLDDVDLQISGRTLYLKTGRVVGNQERNRNRRLIYGECTPCGFTRTVQLPFEIDTDSVDAKLLNGVLRLTLPKVAAQQRRTIRVGQVTA